MLLSDCLGQRIEDDGDLRDATTVKEVDLLLEPGSAGDPPLCFRTPLADVAHFSYLDE